MLLYGAFADPGYTVPGSMALLRDKDEDPGTGSTLGPGPYDAFNVTGTTGLDVTVGTGEGVVHGLLVARDTSTTITVADNTTTTLYIGWVEGARDDLVIGDSSTFSNLTNPYRRMALHDVTASGGTITSTSKLAITGPALDEKNTRYETSDNSGVKVDKAKNADSAGSASSASTADKADMVFDDGANEYIKVFIQSSEPTNVTSRHLWFKPK